METPDAVPLLASQVRPARPRFQFCLRTLLIVMTGLAVVLSGLFSGWTGAALITALVVVILLPMAATIILIYGQGMLRTFMIGALFPLGAFLFFVSMTMPMQGLSAFFGGRPDPDAGLGISIFLLVELTTALVCGLVAVGLRWLIERGN